MPPSTAVLHTYALASRALPLPARYAITAGFVAAATWAQLQYSVDRQHPFLVYVAIVLVTAALLDRGNGFFATGLGAVACSYYFLAPVHSLSVMSYGDQSTLVLFIVVGVALSGIVEMLHHGLVELSVEHERVRKAVADREVLLEELSHRTRNDLARVVALLRMQARTSSQEAGAALSAAADRVQSIARVHRRLDLRNDRVVVDTKSYIDELCGDLTLALFTTRPIAIEQRVESHAIGLDKAVPLGLIINESITNAAKHAFPGDTAGTIRVELRRIENVYRLEIADNGVGLSGAPSREGGLGKGLMQMLAGQIDSRIEIEVRNPGAAVIVLVPVKSGE